MPPPAPSAINISTIEVLQFSMERGLIKLALNWSSPLKTFGNITNYQVRLLSPSLSLYSSMSARQVATTPPEMVR